MQKKATRIRTIRIPVDLDNRISELVQKRLWSVNAWIVNTLKRVSKPKGV